MKKISKKQSRSNIKKRKAKVAVRHAKAGMWTEQPRPMFGSGKVRFEVRGQGTGLLSDCLHLTMLLFFGEAAIQNIPGIYDVAEEQIRIRAVFDCRRDPNWIRSRIRKTQANNGIERDC